MELVTRSQGGDHDAFAALYNAHHGTVSRYISFRVPDRHLAEDIASETFVRAFRRISSYSNHGRPFIAWLTTIARNLIIDHFRMLGRRGEVFALPVDDYHSESWQEQQWLTSVPSAEDEVMDSLERERVRRALSALSPQQRNVLLLQVWGGLKNGEIAERLEIGSTASVRSTRHRAIAALRSALNTKVGAAA
ncbi:MULTISPECIES: RNA polymerase sigma factor [Streptomyces]|nr:sigma-70 family RNA polymerase sigma factor [Streptomyces sp. NEAU-383]